MTTFRIAGIGHALPDGVVTNADLESRMDTSDEWIVARTGIHSRRIGGTTSSLGAEAARRALARATGDIPPVAMIVLATSTPDMVIPATAATIAGELGLTCGTMDVNGACAGFVYAMSAAAGFLAAEIGTVLLIGCDVMSMVTDPNDRGTAILFADGAGALVLAPGGGAELLGWDAGTDPTTLDLLSCERYETIHMEGQAVFKVAVRAAADSAKQALANAGVKPGDLDLFVPHQANQRITDALAHRLGLNDDQVMSTIAETGNSSAGTIPVALSIAYDEGRLNEGDLVLMSGFGAGMTWASAVFRWSST
jgi:3-oxoacyl-[acyl-carrier-protein] synthase-3